MGSGGAPGWSGAMPGRDGSGDAPGGRIPAPVAAARLALSRCHPPAAPGGSVPLGKRRLGFGRAAGLGPAPAPGMAAPCPGPSGGRWLREPRPSFPSSPRAPRVPFRPSPAHSRGSGSLRPRCSPASGALSRGSPPVPVPAVPRWDPGGRTTRDKPQRVGASTRDIGEGKGELPAPQSRGSDPQGNPGAGNSPQR